MAGWAVTCVLQAVSSLYNTPELGCIAWHVVIVQCNLPMHTLVPSHTARGRSHNATTWGVIV